MSSSVTFNVAIFASSCKDNEVNARSNIRKELSGRRCVKLKATSLGLAPNFTNLCATKNTSSLTELVVKYRVSESSAA